MRKKWLWAAIVAGLVLWTACAVGAWAVGGHLYGDHLRLHALEQSVAGTFGQIQVGPGGVLRVPPPADSITTTLAPTTTSTTTLPRAK